jgi:hypothetical protein
MTQKTMNSVDYFNEWYDRIGVRTFSKAVDQHRDYMSMAFLAGWYAHDRNDDSKAELVEQLRRVKDELNCRIP